MDQHHHHHHSYYNNNQVFERRNFYTSKTTPSVRWFKQWVPQDVVATGGKCYVMKWVTEAQLNTIKEQTKEVEAVEPETGPTTEVLFLCSYEGCGKTFIDAGALRKHSHIHGERQYVCHYHNCGKKFLDSSKLKRHFLIHTGERDFICPHEGCGKAFSLDFNLRSHMKTHSQENYHICPYHECGKRYAHEYKLKNHIMSHHEKTDNNMMLETPLKYIHIPTIEKPLPKSTKASTTYASVSSNRPYACPYKGCGKAYIHEYKLNLHLKREHPGHFPEENTKNAFQEMDAGSDHDGRMVKLVNTKSQKQYLRKPNVKLPTRKVIQHNKAPMATAPFATNSMKQFWPVIQDVYEEEDSEETEEDRDDNNEGRWGHGNNCNDEEDDEETEDED